MKNKSIRKYFLILCSIVITSLLLTGYSVCSNSYENTAENINSNINERVAEEQERINVVVEKYVNNMDLSDMIYQMMFVAPESLTNTETVVQAGEEMKAALEKYPVGGVVYFARNLINRDQTYNMIKDTQTCSEIPLFIGVDEEGGRVARLGKNPAMGTTKLPPMKTIGESRNIPKALTVGRILGKDLSALGFNVDFAPDADVIVNEKNSEIGDRSFGSDPELVSIMTASVVKGMQRNGVSATVKHFPGHGSTYVNSHTGYSASDRTIEQLRENEFLPFKSGIRSGVDFVMVSHMTLVNATTEKLPSSLSKEVITDMLINELGFKGIVITDALGMGAIVNEYSSEEIAVKAVNAGADMLLMPSDLEEAHDSLIKAVENGDISEDRIRKSVEKIITLKAEKKMIV